MNTLRQNSMPREARRYGLHRLRRNSIPRSSFRICRNHPFLRNLMKQPLLITLLSTLCTTACTVGPRYQRPATNAPQVYRGATTPDAGQVVTVQELQTEQPKATSLGDVKWAEVFRDPALQQLIREALANNYDVKIAAQRVLEEQDQVGITRAQQFPTVNGGGSYYAIGLPKGLVKSLNSSTNNKNYSASNYYAGGLTLSSAWNLDFWGLYRRQTEAARAQLLATEWGRRMTISTVVENVATAYLQLRTLDAELEITKQTLEARKQSLQLTQTLDQGGSGSLADVRQAEQLLYTAAAAIPDFERQIEQQENSISILLGRNPGPIIRGASEMNWPQPEQIPAGIPSQLLERRPDIQQAEATLIAANANVGVAKAQLFPQLSLSGTGGIASSQLKGLVDGKNLYWYSSGTLTQPIFDAGRLRSNLRLSEAQKQEQVLAYQRTIKEAFESVSDALIGLEKYREFREQEAKLTASAEDATRLARLRYNGGSTSYLEVLTNDTNYYSAQLNLAVAQENEALSIVQLYSALGGGWQE
jgi:outer membrane protein, multidrug efflux system